MSLPNFHYQIVILPNCHYQIVITKLSLPIRHCQIVSFLELPKFSLQNCHFYEVTKLSLFCSYQIVITKLSSYQIGITKLKSPNFHYQIFTYMYWPNCRYQIVITKLKSPNWHNQINTTKHPPVSEFYSKLGENVQSQSSFKTMPTPNWSLNRRLFKHQWNKAGYKISLLYFGQTVLGSVQYLY